MIMKLLMIIFSKFAYSFGSGFYCAEISEIMPDAISPTASLKS